MMRAVSDEKLNSVRVASGVWPLVLTVAILSIPVAAYFVADALLIHQRYFTDLNSEGWNAYNATIAVTNPIELYPHIGSLWYNNYPPLSFIVVGNLARFIGDAVVAGRMLSLVSTAIVAIAIAAAAGGMECNKLERALASLIFLASPWVLTKYAGTNDPQMLGQALDSIGFAIVVRAPRAASAIIVGSLFFACAEFVKPLFVDQPIALLIWLSVYERKNAVVLVVSMATFGLIGLFATDIALNTDLIAHLFSPRIYTLSRIPAHLGQWLVSGCFALGTTLYLLCKTQDKYAILCGVYALVALASSLFFGGGEGVGGNPTFDLSIAVSLGMAVFVSRSRKAHFFQNAFGNWMAATVSPVTAILLLAVLLVAVFVGWDSGRPLIDQLRQSPSASRDITYLAERPGPALCEALALCYWAGKEREVDLWGLSQAITLGVPGTDKIFLLIRDKYFATIQLDKISQRWFPPELRSAILRYYRPVQGDGNVDFFVPRHDQISRIIDHPISRISERVPAVFIITKYRAIRAIFG